MIRTDGIEAFRLQVDTNGPVESVSVDRMRTPFLVAPEPAPFALRDDGLAGDHVAGDFVFTSGEFRFNTVFGCPQFRDSLPSGLAVQTVASISVHETGGGISTFLVEPEIGLLCSQVPTITSRLLRSDIAASSHLVNVRTEKSSAQAFLRVLDPTAIPEATRSMYSAVADVFDFIMLFSTSRVELVPNLSERNLVAGTHQPVKVNFTGTGQPLFDDTASYGSDGRLLAVNVLDTYSRGLNSRVATHELLHEWGAFLSASLGISDGEHFLNTSNVGSILGGFRWIPTGDGTFSIDCDEGANGAFHAPALDKYLMGLIPGDGVPPVHNDTEVRLFECSNIVRDFTTVTMEQIQAENGVRSPGPEDAQREFVLGFVAESIGRLLNPTEMTFYDTLAREYTRALAPGEPDPFVGRGWVSIDRFFGAGITWRSDLPPDVQVTKTGPSPVEVGETAAFEIVVTNDGPGDASSVTLEDELPVGIRWTEDSAECVIVTGALSCDFGDLATASSRRVILSSGLTSAVDCGTLSNAVTVRAANEPTMATGNNGAIAAIAVDCPPPAKTVEAIVREGVELSRRASISRRESRLRGGYPGPVGFRDGAGRRAPRRDR